MQDRLRNEGSVEQLPYFYDVNGNLPSWFNPDGVFDPKRFDPSILYLPKGDTFELAVNPGRKIENPFDLRNLRFINPQDVLDALHKLEESSKNSLPSICVVATGGTIATKRVGNTLVPGLDINYLFEYSGKLIDKNWNRASLSFPTLIDSSQMKLDFDADAVIAMSYIWTAISEQAKRGFRGFALTHGTDTMAQSATRIAMMLGSNIDFSVGVVGSQIGIDSDFNEVADNITRCLATLDKLYGEDRNVVFIYMGGSAGGAYNPVGSRKRSDTDIAAFESQAIPQILDASNVQRMRELQLPFANTYKSARNSRQDVFQPIIVRGMINSRKIQADMDIPPDELKRVIQNYNQDVIAVLLETYGSFTFDQQQVDAIMDAARERKLLTFATNPFPTGRVDHEYADAQYLIEQGAIPLHMMPHAAAVKLKIGEAIWGRDNETIEAFMTSNDFIGEQPNTWTPRLSKNQVRRTGQPIDSIAKTKLLPYPTPVSFTH